MRRVRDRDLPAPFAAWIDSAEPLPPGVVLLPRSVSIARDAWVLVFPGLAFVGMGVAFLAVVWDELANPRPDLVAFLALALAILFGLPLYLVVRLCRTLAARRDQKAGTLRLGVFVGPEGVLARVAPNRCYPIPMNRFTQAKGGLRDGGDTADWTCLHTLDGPVELFDDHLAFGPAEVNAAVENVRGKVVAPPAPVGDSMPAFDPDAGTFGTMKFGDDITVAAFLGEPDKAEDFGDLGLKFDRRGLTLFFAGGEYYRVLCDFAPEPGEESQPGRWSARLPLTDKLELTAETTAAEVKAAFGPPVREEPVVKSVWLTYVRDKFYMTFVTDPATTKLTSWWAEIGDED